MTWCRENYFCYNEFQRFWNSQNLPQPNPAPKHWSNKSVYSPVIRHVTDLNPHTPPGTVLKRTVRAGWFVFGIINVLDQSVCDVDDFLGCFWDKFGDRFGRKQIRPGRGQDGPMRAIKSFKAPKSCMLKQKPETTDSFRRFVGSGDLTGEPSEAQKRFPRDTQRVPKLWKRNSKLTSLFFAKYERILGAVHFGARILSLQIWYYIWIRFWIDFGELLEPMCSPDPSMLSRDVANASLACAGELWLNRFWPWLSFLFSTLESIPMDCSPWEDHS